MNLKKKITRPGQQSAISLLRGDLAQATQLGPLRAAQQQLLLLLGHRHVGVGLQGGDGALLQDLINLILLDIHLADELPRHAQPLALAVGAYHGTRAVAGRTDALVALDHGRAQERLAGLRGDLQRLGAVADGAGEVPRAEAVGAEHALEHLDAALLVENQRADDADAAAQHPRDVAVDAVLQHRVDDARKEAALGRLLRQLHGGAQVHAQRLHGGAASAAHRPHRPRALEALAGRQRQGQKAQADGLEAPHRSPKPKPDAEAWSWLRRSSGSRGFGLGLG
mmetsp:Transcript_16554/g.50827  ORF Transcript_16554/g.50827 Transcript_16554/m.50827 type:complete len:281 (+) Transcript_16554:942-1784(+)